MNSTLNHVTFFGGVPEREIRLEIEGDDRELYLERIIRILCHRRLRETGKSLWTKKVLVSLQLGMREFLVCEQWCMGVEIDFNKHYDIN